MKDIKTYFGIVSTIVILSTLINIFFISPKKAIADNTFKVSNGNCLNTPYTVNNLHGATHPGDSSFNRVYTQLAFQYINVQSNWVQCTQGDVAIGIKFAKMPATCTACPGDGADGVYLELTCCTPVTITSP